MEIKIYATLRQIAGGKSIHLDTTPPTSVGQMVEALFARYPAMQDTLLLRNGDMHSAFHILINGRDARYLNGMETIISGEDDVRIFPPVGGGEA